MQTSVSIQAQQIRYVIPGLLNTAFNYLSRTGVQHLLGGGWSFGEVMLQFSLFPNAKLCYSDT